MSSGNIVVVIGAVVDVRFPRDGVPKVYDALTINVSDGKGLTLRSSSSNWVIIELFEPLLWDMCLTVLSRGLEVKTPASPISVPVGEEVLGRIVNVYWVSPSMISWSSRMQKNTESIQFTASHQHTKTRPLGGN